MVSLPAFDLGIILTKQRDYVKVQERIGKPTDTVYCKISLDFGIQLLEQACRMS